jgi:hypothetical protein
MWNNEQQVSMPWLQPEEERVGCRQERVSVTAGLSAIPRVPSVYFLLSHDASMAKIGKSMRPRARIREIRHMNPHVVSVLLTIPGYTHVEAWCHGRFGHLRSHGEWFFYRTDLVEFVDALKSGSTAIDAHCYTALAMDARELVNLASEQHQVDE